MELPGRNIPPQNRRNETRDRNAGEGRSVGANLILRRLENSLRQSPTISVSYGHWRADGIFERKPGSITYSAHLLFVFSSESGTRSGFYRRPAARRASAFPVPHQTNSSVTNAEDFLQVPPQKRPLALEARPTLVASRSVPRPVGRPHKTE